MYINGTMSVQMDRRVIQENRTDEEVRWKHKSHLVFKNGREICQIGVSMNKPPGKVAKVI